ncbi:MAG: response regulator [Balneolaceae bacterium]
MAVRAAAEGAPYSLIFMDVRMPPGMNGVRAIREIWNKLPETEIVICTAYSDYSWGQILEQLGASDRLQFLKKPFDATSIRQMALTMTTKWLLLRERYHYMRTLEEKVEERTGQLLNMVKEFKGMRERAEEIADTKSRFLAHMSHEIRTPLSSIVGMSRLMMETDLDEEQEEAIWIIKESSDTLSRLVNDILDYSKMEAGKMGLEEVRIEIQELVDTSVAMISQSAEEKQLVLKIDVDESVPEVLYGDPVRLKQILLNYLGNAVKFTDQGSVVVRVQAEDRSEDSACMLIRFTVEDTGIGIPEEKQKQLFSEYSQAASDITRKYGGTGLGLVISRQLASLMGGETGFDSQPGEGSRFWFTARLGTTPPTDGNEGKENEYSDENVASGMPDPVRILIAEDSRMNQVMTARILEKAGCLVDLVKTGCEAVRAVENNTFHMILMDIHMPEMGGLEATRIIRASEEATESDRISIVALTATSTKEEREACLEAGMDDVVTKPMSTEALSDLLERHLAGSKNLEK